MQNVHFWPERVQKLKTAIWRSGVYIIRYGGARRENFKKKRGAKLLSFFHEGAKTPLIRAREVPDLPAARGKAGHFSGGRGWLIPSPSDLFEMFLKPGKNK